MTRYVDRINLLPPEIVGRSINDPLIAAVVHQFGLEERMTVVECLSLLVSLLADERTRCQKQLERAIKTMPIAMIV